MYPLLKLPLDPVSPQAASGVLFFFLSTSPLFSTSSFHMTYPFPLSRYSFYLMTHTLLLLFLLLQHDRPVPIHSPTRILFSPSPTWPPPSIPTLLSWQVPMSWSLRCHVSHRGEPHLLLRPLRYEQLHTDPEIYLFHNVLSHAEMQLLRDISLNEVQ